MSLTILVADDEPAIVRAVSRFLEKAGHVVHSASNASDGVGLVDRYAFDAALVDGRMPGDGRTVLRHLAAQPDFSGPMFLMSGDLPRPDDDLPDGVRHLQKPFDFTRLAELVEGR